MSSCSIQIGDKVNVSSYKEQSRQNKKIHFKEFKDQLRRNSSSVEEVQEIFDSLVRKTTKLPLDPATASILKLGGRLEPENTTLQTLLELNNQVKVETERQEAEWRTYLMLDEDIALYEDELTDPEHSRAQREIYSKMVTKHKNYYL